MMWNILSFFLSHEEAFLTLNTNILETNAINLFILLGLLAYGNKISVQPNLEKRRKEIIQTLENAQKDVLAASNYYSLAEQGFLQNIFWLQSWKKVYLLEKKEIVNKKYKLVKNNLLDNFRATEKFLTNFETKSFLNLQKYILFFLASRILRKFLFLSEIEQSKFLEGIIKKLGGN
jgi:hypothetical protein